MFISFVLVYNNMVTIVEKKSGNKKSYYLHHTLRTKEGYKSLEKYIGDRLPSNIEERKIEFFLEAYEDIFNEIETIRNKQIELKSKLPDSIKRKNELDFSINFTYNTNRIEGSTLSLKDTYNLIDNHIVPEKKPLRDIKETENHQKLFFNLINDNSKVSYSNVLKWHNDIFFNTKPDISGKVRDYQVAIAQSKFLPPSPAEVYSELKAFFRWYNSKKDKYHPVILSALSHMRFVSVHPFGDGNGRISRIIMNVILGDGDYPLYIIDYKDRDGYYNALERAHNVKDDFKFLAWFVRNYRNYIRDRS